MSSTEYKPPARSALTALQRVWSPQDHRDTVRDAIQLAALKRMHQQLETPRPIWDSIVIERALLGTLPKPVGRLDPIDKLLVGWPARVVCPAVCP